MPHRYVGRKVLGGARRAGRTAARGVGRAKTFVVHRPWLTGLIVMAVILSGIVYAIFDNQRRNHEAIEKGCILLNNLVIKSSAPSGRSQVLINEIIKLAKDNGDTKFLNKFQQAPANSDVIKFIVNCRQIANHPEDIHQEQLSSP